MNLSTVSVIVEFNIGTYIYTLCYSKHELFVLKLYGVKHLKKGNYVYDWNIDKHVADYSKVILKSIIWWIINYQLLIG